MKLMLSRPHYKTRTFRWYPIEDTMARHGFLVRRRALVPGGYKVASIRSKTGNFEALRADLKDYEVLKFSFEYERGRGTQVTVVVVPTL